MEGVQIGQVNLPEKKLVYRLFEVLGSDGHTYWRMEKSKGGSLRPTGSYSLHRRACPECGKELLVCDCNAFFWKGACKHIAMHSEIMGKRAVSGSDSLGDPDRGQP